YALTPQLEDIIYHDALYTETSGPAISLAEQIAIAREAMGPNARLEAIRPAPEPGTTTRVMFGVDGLGPSEHHAIFVDPVSGEVRASLEVYGTSGVLPLRSVLDRVHRGLLLGDVGRLYSELAASWLWILAMGGLALWWTRRRRRRAGSSSNTHRPVMSGEAPHRLRRWHGTLGAWAFLGVLFFSVTGLTWSNHAGSNIGVLRAHYGWGTPSVSTDLPSVDAASPQSLASPIAASMSAPKAAEAPAIHDEHAGHRAAASAPSGDRAAPAASGNRAMYATLLGAVR